MRIVTTLVLACTLTSRAAAQGNLAPFTLSDWERDKATVLAYIKASPDSTFGYRPTPGVRTLAEQYDHIVSTNLEVAAVALRGLKTPPVLGDSTKYLHDKAALLEYAGKTYDYMIQSIKDASSATLAKPIVMYGQPPQPASRLVQLSLEHSVWTLGQVVPYLRLNGVKSPNYDMPF